MGSQVVLLTDISSVLLPSVSTTLTKDELVTRLQLFENGILKLLVGLRTRILSSVPKLNLKSFSSQEHLPCSKDSSFFSELLSESLNSLTKELLSHWSRRNDSGVTIPLLSKPPYEMLQKALEEIAVVPPLLVIVLPFQLWFIMTFYRVCRF